MKDSNLPIKYKESIFKNILNKIKSVFIKNHKNKENNNQNHVEEHTENVYKSFINDIKRNSRELESRDNSITKGNIEYALDQFNQSLYFQYENIGNVRPYSALIQLGANKIQDSNGNDIKEKTLIETLKDNYSEKKFELYEQKNQNNDTVFYHVKTAEYVDKKAYENSDQMRLYINCNRENVATLAGKMLSEMQNDSLYLKFSSDKQLGTVERSEAIVIYTDTKNASKIINKIEQIHKKEPKLFKNSNNMNPFLKNINGIVGYAPQIEEDRYYKADGRIETMAKSYNSFVSKALEQSFISTAREYVARSKQLTEKTGGVISDDINFYIKLFPEFKNGDYNGFLEKMKQNLKAEKSRNSIIDVKGLEEDKRDEGR